MRGLVIVGSVIAKSFKCNLLYRSVDGGTCLDRFWNGQTSKLRCGCEFFTSAVRDKAVKSYAIRFLPIEA